MVSGQAHVCVGAGVTPRRPACFSSLAQWKVYNDLVSLSADEGHTYCTDCTKLFKDTMVKQGRCSYPKTTFKHLPGGGMLGRRRK